MHHRLKTLSTLFVVLSVIGNTFAPIETKAATFSDTDGHQYQEAIEFLNQKGVVQGYDNGTFRPDTLINRAEMLKIILVAELGNEAAVGQDTRCFTDVHEEWFAKFVCYAKSKNIVRGYAGNRFDPNRSVNMVEALKMALETFKKQLPTLQGDEEWYQPYREFAHINNIFSKYSYVPGKFMTRGEMAFLIHALLLDREGTRAFTGARQSLSSGCGKRPPGVPPTASMIDGVERTYITDVPGTYNSNTPMALTFGWHGRTNPNTQVRGYYRVYQAAEGDTIMVYPAALEGGWKVDRDQHVFDQLLQEFSENYCIDFDRIYIVGHSLGAWFTNSLSCIRGHVIRASGSLGGGTTINNCTGPVAAMILQNPADKLSPLSAGITARDQLLKQNDCRATTVPYPGPDKSNCVEYTECSPDAPVIWCPHTEDYSWGDYYPHGWPRWTGGLIWSFFASLNGN